MEKNANIIPWDLIIGQLKQELTDEEFMQLEQWKMIQKNTELFEEIELLWNSIQNSCITYIPDKEFYWKKISQHINASRDEEIGIKTNTQWGLKRFYKYIAAACIIILVGTSFYIGSNMQHVDNFKQEYASLSGKSKIILPDGSLVWLNAQSSLSYDDRFLKEKRIVKLSGEAYFDIVHSKSCPFVVNTEGVDVEVHGTKFNVESYKNDGYVQVSLQEGAVSIHTKDENVFLKPGEAGTYNKQSKKMIIAQSDIGFTISWAQDKLEFNNRPLGDICRFLSKWYHVKIEVHPSLLELCNYTFTLRNEPLEEILRLMAKIHPLKYHFDENNNLHIMPLQ